MKQERIIWGGGINRSRDPRYIENHEQYDAYNLEVIERGTLSKRKGFYRHRTTGDRTFDDVVRGEALMYDSDGNRYLFVFYDASPATDLWIEKAAGTPLIITDFFPSSGYRVRAAVFGDRIYFVNGVDRPRWYKEYDGSNHIWGIAGVPSPARRPADESNFDYFISRALYADTITSSEGLGIESPGIWRYKQAVGYYGKVSDEQVEESNAGPASKMFHCQFNTAETLGTQLQGYIEKGIPIGIADFGDLILDAGEAGGQDYEDEIRWMRMYRQWKMFSDELYSPFEFLAEMKKGWPISIRDVYSRDSAVVAPTTRVQIPVSHHIEKANNRLFLGRIEKELFKQPGLPNDFRGYTGSYKPDFPYRMPITVHNTNPKTLTSAIIPLRFQDYDSDDHTATPPSGGGTWVGAYINTSLDLWGNGWFQMMFVDEDGVTPLGFCRISSSENDDVTFLVEIPEIAAGGSRTIYLYFEDSALSAWNPANYAGESGHWRSIAHYRLLESSHDFLIDFENWEFGMAVTDVTQKRSLGKIGNVVGVVQIVDDKETRFFGDNAKEIDEEKSLRIISTVAPQPPNGCSIPFWTSSTSLSEFSFVFAAIIYASNPTGTEKARVRLTDGALTTHSVDIEFKPIDASLMDVVATVYDTDATSYSLTLSNVSYTDTWLYFLVQIEGANFRFICVKNGNTGHPGEGVAWGDTGSLTTYSENRADIAKPIRFFSDGKFYAQANSIGVPESNVVWFKEVEVTERIVDGSDELTQMSMHDSYWLDYGVATAEDRESATGEKHPDRMYFSKLNQPNSFEAVDFRDMGELGRPIQGIRGIGNRVFVFDENKIRALFSAGAEQALALQSADTTSWILSQDLTGERGGLGVLAPDSLVNMEFAGRDGVGFLSRRGFYFFDGNVFMHISEKVDNLIYDEGVSDDYRRNLVAHFLGKKRQLILSVLGWYVNLDYEYWTLVANMKFAHDAAGVAWSRWSNLIKYGVELDFNIDTGEFVYANVPDGVHTQRQLLRMNATTWNAYSDYSEDVPAGTPVIASAMSKQFDVFDAELLKCDLHTSGDSGYAVDLMVFKDSLDSSGLTISNKTNGMYRFPIGTNATLFLFQLYENSAFRTVFEKLDFYFNVHGERRLS